MVKLGQLRTKHGPKEDQKCIKDDQMLWILLRINVGLCGNPLKPMRDLHLIHSRFIWNPCSYVDGFAYRGATTLKKDNAPIRLISRVVWKKSQKFKVNFTINSNFIFCLYFFVEHIL